MARRRLGAPPVRRRRRSVRGRPAPWDRHRRCRRRRRRGSRDGRRLVCRAASARRALPDDSHARRLLDHARPSRIDRHADRDCDRGRRDRRHDRPQRRPRMGRAVRPPRDPADRRTARLRRPAVTSSRACDQPPGTAPGGADPLRGRSRTASAGGRACRVEAEPIADPSAHRGEETYACAHEQDEGGSALPRGFTGRNSCEARARFRHGALDATDPSWLETFGCRSFCHGQACAGGDPLRRSGDPARRAGKRVVHATGCSGTRARSEAARAQARSEAARARRDGRPRRRARGDGSSRWQTATDPRRHAGRADAPP